MVNTLKYVVLGIYKLINDVTYFYFLLKKFFDFDRKTRQICKIEKPQIWTKSSKNSFLEIFLKKLFKLDLQNLM